MNIDYLFPINKSHSIQHVLFSLEWQGELTEDMFKHIHELAPKLKSNFPNSKLVKLMEGASSNKEHIVQVVFERVGKTGNVVSQINVSQSKCIIVISEYIRWKPTLEVVMRYFKILLSEIMKEKSIDTISLQYIDVFTWKDDPENLDLHKVFKKDTPFLAPNIFDQKNICHCQYGYLIEKFLGLDGKCLDNINVSIVENQNDRVIQIQTIHQFTLNKPLRMATKDYLQSIEQVQNKLHDHNKDTLKKLFSNEVCAKIDLVNRGGEDETI